MSENVKKAEGGLTRREMLKKSALVGAVAWTIPIVGSFNAAAFASTTVSPAACVHHVCGAFVECGSNPDELFPLDKCFCTTDIADNAFCFNNASCANVPKCEDGDEPCPPGYACITDSCCNVPTCAPPCGVFARDPLPNSEAAGAAGATGAAGAAGPTIASV